MNTDHFYDNLKTIKNFHDISKNSVFTAVPKDWFILLSDVKNSTQAIKNGKYKEVNMLGALSIISVLNIEKKLDIPFVFGGDGAFLLIPPTLLNDAKQALLAVQKMAKDAYDLELRIGAIAVDEIYQNNKELLITKFKVAQGYSQAMLKGSGLAYSDILLKSSDTYHIKESIDPNFSVDIKGLACRWENIPSPKNETISLLVRASDQSYYKEILENLENILGTKKSRNPITKTNTILSFDDKVLAKEVSLHTQNRFLKALLILKLKFINVMGNYLMDSKIGEWANYRTRITNSTDTEKFDDILRMVFTADFAQTKKLEAYLSKEYKEKNLTYGLHKADASLMTCLIFETHGKHIHFVDSANGGYAMAAIDLKARISH
ncbi:MAG: DUF3095 domain-containing protein [Arcobacteraceae bacterium]